MGAAAARTRGGPGPLIWLLLPLLLPLSPEATTATQPGSPSPSQAPGEVAGSPGVQDGARPAARPQGSAGGAQGGPRDDVNRVCGKPTVVEKVYGGQDAEAGQWPWQASLLYRGKHLCGAVLISSRWLLSTAHCFVNNSQAPEDYRILLGNTHLYQQTQHTQKMSVSQIITHPDFEKFHPFGSDIAMLKLHLPVNFTPHVVPACLPPPDMRLTKNMSCWITGWGMLSEDMRLLPPFSLQEGKVGLMENAFCNIIYARSSDAGQDYFVDENMLCAGDFSTGRSICRGDSGGPLVCYHLGAWVLVGLASWGLDCRHPVYPSVFTRVAYFTDWISSVKRLNPPPDPAFTFPHTDVPRQSPRAAGSPGPHGTLTPTATRLLLPLIFTSPWQAPG